MNGQIYPISCLEDYFKNSAVITDKSSLSKLQDTFPIEIFNLQIFLEVLNSDNFDLKFSYFRSLRGMNHLTIETLVSKHVYICYKAQFTV